MDTVSENIRAERLGFRLDASTKALIERAAAFEHRKISDFCLTAISEAARRVVAEHETLVLSERDREVFFDALINPPPLNDRMKRAFAAHRALINP